MSDIFDKILAFCANLHLTIYNMNDKMQIMTIGDKANNNTEEIMKKLIALLMATFMVVSLCAVCAVADEEYIKVAVSHQDCYTWTCGRDAMVITSGKITDVSGGTYYTGASWYVYVIENIDGVYTATRCLTDNDEIGETAAPAGGFLLCIDSSAHQYETIKDTLVGYTFHDNDNAIADGKATSGLATADDDDPKVEPVYIYAKAPAATIEMKDFFISHYNDSYVEGAGVIFTEAYSGAAWWIHVSFKPVEGKTGVYEVVETSNGLADGSATALALPEGGFVYAANTGNDYPTINADGSGIDYTNDAVNSAIEIVKTMTVGSQWVFEGLDLESRTVPTTTPDTKWYDDCYVCTAKVGAYVEGAVIPGTGDDDEEPEMETITVDGDLTDTGWTKKGWATIDSADNGTWQGGASVEGFSYKYQIRKDDTKLYIATVYNSAAAKVAAGSTSANGSGTNFRFWIHNGDAEATVYTHFVDICLCEDGTTGSMMKVNGSKNSNAAGEPITDSSLKAVVVEKDGKTYCEVSIDLADIGVAEGKTASVIPCISSLVDGTNYCLFAGVYPDVEEGAEYATNLPYHHWYASEAVEITEDMVLGEVVPEQPATGDMGIVALVVLAVVSLFGSAIVVRSRH